MQSLYEAAGGLDGLRRLAGAWHARVMADEVVSHAFSHGFHPEHTERLAAYWAEALGGPAAYSGAYGDESSVVRMHSGNGPHEEMDRRAIACFDQALEDAGLTAEPLGQVLHDYFAWATTTTMARYHESADDVPEGLTIPRWSWDGFGGRVNVVMKIQRFKGSVAAGPRGSGLIVIPFDPDQAWGAKSQHRVGGRVNGRRVRGSITPGGGGWAFTLTPIWLRDAGVAVGDEVTAELAPEGPQRDDLADDVRAARIAEVVDLLAAGLKERPRP